MRLILPCLLLCACTREPPLTSVTYPSMPNVACPAGHSCTFPSVGVSPVDLLVIAAPHEWRFYRPGKAGDDCEELVVEGCWVLVSTSPR
jgi:hypothetical protein